MALENLLNLLSPDYYLTMTVKLKKIYELTQRSAKHIEGAEIFLDSNLSLFSFFPRKTKCLSKLEGSFVLKGSSLHFSYL